MLSLTVSKMKCGGCSANIEKAIKSVDANAQVTVDLVTKRVDIESTSDANTLTAAITTAGYDPVAA